MQQLSRKLSCVFLYLCSFVCMNLWLVFLISAFSLTM
jgi:hypothetical protein